MEYLRLQLRVADCIPGFKNRQNIFGLGFEAEFALGNDSPAVIELIPYLMNSLFYILL